jgi:hypothetical protein
MNITAQNTPSRLARLTGAVSLAVMVAACTAAGASNAPATSGPGGTTSPSSTGGFYLRAWQTQALAPQYTFGSLPAATISDGQFYDGMVAIPMIYPGPIYTGLSSQTLSAAGIARIVAEAQADGLLGATTNFVQQALPGGISCNVEIVVDGTTHDLIGQCPSAAAPALIDPGTPAAFAAFWTKLTSVPTWLATDLGPSVSYQPARLAVLVGPPSDATGGMAPNEKPWPLSTPFASFGAQSGSVDYRCAIVSGDDLAKLLPAVEASNGLTRFVDSDSVRKQLQVRVVLPGEPGPC